MDVVTAIMHCRRQKLKDIQVEFAVEIKPGGIHPTEGLPLLYFDQLSAVNRQVQEIKGDLATTAIMSDIPSILPGTPIASLSLLHNS